MVIGFIAIAILAASQLKTSAPFEPPSKATQRQDVHSSSATATVMGVQLVDETQILLGNTASYREQLSRGVDYWRGRLDASQGFDSNGNQGIAIGDVNGERLRMTDISHEDWHRARGTGYLASLADS